MALKRGVCVCNIEEDSGGQLIEERWNTFQIKKGKV